MTPEKALGRLINLREQLTAEKKVVQFRGQQPDHYVSMHPGHYAVIIDDLDDIIRSIERDVKDEQTRWYEAALEPDSEDMEAR